MNSARFRVSADAVKVTMEDLKVVEEIVRKDPKVIEQCVISGIAAEDMHKVYCDGMKHIVFDGRRSCLHSLDDWL